MIFGGYHLPRLQTKERAGAWQKEKKKREGKVAQCQYYRYLFLNKLSDGQNRARRKMVK